MNELFRNPHTGEWFCSPCGVPPVGYHDWNPHEATNLCDHEAAFGEVHEAPTKDRLGKRPEQADGQSCRAGGYHQLVKRQQNRLERRRAKRFPECVPAYRHYAGYET